MDMLLPYLKSYANSSISSASNPLSFADQCLISLKITTMLSWISVLPSAKNFVMARCEDIELDLRNIALKLNNSNVESAVVCMVNIAVRVTNNTNSILSLLQKCYEGIMSIIRHYENSPHLNSVSGDTVRNGFICIFYATKRHWICYFCIFAECSASALPYCTWVRL